MVLLHTLPFMYNHIVCIVIISVFYVFLYEISLQIYILNVVLCFRFLTQNSEDYSKVYEEGANEIDNKKTVMNHFLEEHLKIPASEEDKNNNSHYNNTGLCTIRYSVNILAFHVNLRHY